MSMIINPYRYAAAPSSAFGLASRDFDGINDRVETPLTNALGDFSACAWFLYDTKAGFERLLDKNYEFGFWMGWNANATAFGGGIRRGTAPFGNFPYNSLTSGNWYHIVMTRSGTTQSLYLDGANKNTYTVSSTPLNTSALYIAGENPTDSYWDGKLADVRIYSRAISDSEAADLAAGNDIDDTGLEGWWLLNDDDVLDYSGNSRDGTNYGSTYSTDGPLD